ncbi:MAG: phosphoribosylpyrophosphate synthetase [Legionellales bacterium RIFCSPHIGHO2_12_FULL_42_9]|nr:MAG: phosphoribosylpyrophosphate synthetase [Legionellales bacterium RIFCSPHIGHO2_12_FULL_42_9]
MKPIVFSLFGHSLLGSIAEKLELDIGKMTYREFPDAETYLCFHSVLQDRHVIILDSLDRPNPKIIPLLFAAKTAKKMGAKSIGLTAPYLAYMRQDKQFNIGEGITSEYFAKMLSDHFDWLITIDPHLHRHQNLNEIYTIQNNVLHAAHLISSWIRSNVNNPVLIGPDSESEQWVSGIAKEADAPYLILEKVRRSDDQVEIKSFNILPYRTHTPVLVDDIISTAHTMIEVINHLKTKKMKSPMCIGVHAIFANDAYRALQEAGAERIVTCNSVPHASNQIDISDIICQGIQNILIDH